MKPAIRFALYAAAAFVMTDAVLKAVNDPRVASLPTAPAPANTPTPGQRSATHTGWHYNRNLDVDFVLAVIDGSTIHKTYEGGWTFRYGEPATVVNTFDLGVADICQINTVLPYADGSATATFTAFVNCDALDKE